MASIDVERVRPAGGKRSSKRDFIVNAFLRQEGHLSADDLVDLIRKEDRGISRATVYRTLQWMMDTGIARKVDFGEGRFRFEHVMAPPDISTSSARPATSRSSFSAPTSKR
jgi:Fe2+ or Zn2+ uptake regulation protein